jgi:hypothetical protein
MKVYRENRVTVTLTLNLGTLFRVGGDDWSASRPGRFTQGNEPW